MHRRTDRAREPRVPALHVSVLFDAAAGTHAGWKYAENQDAVLLGRRVWQKPLIRTCVDRPSLLAAVADGVAFAPCAARASRMVLEELVRLVEARGGLDAFAPRDIHRAMASTAAGTACAGMAATLAAVEFTEAQVRIVSVGDSLVYRYRAGQLLPLTVDHTLARRLVRTGELTQAQADRAGDLYQDLDSALVASESETEFEVHHATSGWRCAWKQPPRRRTPFAPSSTMRGARAMAMTTSARLS